MSIYATLSDFRIALHRGTQEVWVNVAVQAVPPHITDTGPEWDWLPPPVPDGENAPFNQYRAVFITYRFVTCPQCLRDVGYRFRCVCGAEVPHTSKATERNGQEYVGHLMQLGHDDYMGRTFHVLMQEVETALYDIWERHAKRT